MSSSTPLETQDEEFVSVRRWRIVGPGLVVAATGIGAADLVATLAAGSRFGYTLLWAAIAGCIMKVILVEGAGRWTLATGRTIFDGWRSLGPWTSVYFGPYIVLWGFVYGASAMLATGIPIASLLPFLGDALGENTIPVVATVAGVAGLLMVWVGRYHLVEKAMAVMVGIMFVAVIGSAVVVLPNLGEVVAGLLPVIPTEPGANGLFYTLGMAGGVGGTITLAAYGYWLREKGWTTPKFMKVMRLDNGVAYILSGVFVIAMLIVGAELFYTAGQDVATNPNEALLGLSDALAARYGEAWSVIFLLGFAAASFSSLIGVWNGVSLMFADFVGNWRGLSGDDPRVKSGGSYFKVYALWLTIPPLVLVWFTDNPVGVIVLYGVLGALFMPFLAVTLLFLLNSDRVPQRWRNGIVRNTGLGVITLLFLVLGVHQVIGSLPESWTGWYPF